MMIQCDPKVAELRRRCNDLRQEIKSKHGKIKSVEGTEIHRRYQLLRRELRAEIQYQRKERFREEREQFFNTIDSREIQQQFPGSPSSSIDEEHADTDIVQHMSKERIRIADTLFRLSADLTEQECCRLRVETLTDLVALCKQREAPRQTRLFVREGTYTFLSTSLQKEDGGPYIKERTCC